MWHEVSAKAKGKANAEFGFLGFCHFPGLVKKYTVSKLLKSAAQATYYPIFNLLKKTASKRAAAKADDLGCLVVQQVVVLLKDCLIAGPQHILEMARGASFLRSLPAVCQQDTHTDVDFQDIILPPGFRRVKPFSIWIALADDSCLCLAGVVRSYKAGDVVVFAGDCSHSGAANVSEETNYRLFSYVPTRAFEVPWAFDQCTQQVKSAAKEVTSPEEVARLHVVTNPLNAKFQPDEHSKYLFDVKTCKFYEFTIPLWLGGLDTAVPDQQAYSLGISLQQKFSPATGCFHCPHFDVDQFNPTTANERTVLNDFRSQCVYCQAPKQKKKRSRDDQS